MRFSKILRDPRGYLFYKMRINGQRISSFFSTFYFRLMLHSKNVTYGKRIQTYGRTYINRQPLSKITIGDNVVFRSSFTTNLIGVNRPCMLSTLNADAIIEIGSGCGFSGAVIGAADKIILGNHVLVGANTLITDTDWHNIHPDFRREPCTSFKPIVIGDNVWLGINTVVLKGVNIGRNSIIAANSVVVKDIPENVIAGGNPCKIIKQIEL